MTKGYKFLYNLLAPLLRLIFGVKVINPEKEPNAHFLVCSNHISALDPIVIAASLKKHQVHFMGKKSLFKVPVLGWLIKMFGAFPVDRDGSGIDAIKTSIKLLESSECVGIFPQGHRNPGVIPRGTPIKNGAGMITSRAKTMVFPVHIKTKGYKKPLFRRTYVIYGDPIPFEDFIISDGDSSSETNRKITAEIFDRICTLGENHEA